MWNCTYKWHVHFGSETSRDNRTGHWTLAPSWFLVKQHLVHATGSSRRHTFTCSVRVCRARGSICVHRTRAYKCVYVRVYAYRCECVRAHARQRERGGGGGGGGEGGGTEGKKLLKARPLYLRERDGVEGGWGGGWGQGAERNPSRLHYCTWFPLVLADTQRRNKASEMQLTSP